MRRTSGLAGLMLGLLIAITACAGADIGLSSEPTAPGPPAETSGRTPKPTKMHTATEERSCDPNYRGACVPIASDVDCAGGSGNGPAYVRGPVTVIGSDIYDLDRDGDGVGCEPS